MRMKDRSTPKNKESMPSEVQEIVLQATFSVTPRVYSGKGSGFMFVPGGVRHSNWELDPFMVVAAKVCKTWRAAYERCLMAQTGGIFRSVLPDVVGSAMDLCDYEKYHDEMPARSRMTHFVYAGRKLLFTMTFTRTKDAGRQRFDAVYGGGGSVAVRSVQYFKLWRDKEAQALEEWLVEQHAKCTKNGRARLFKDAYDEARALKLELATRKRKRLL